MSKKPIPDAECMICAETPCACNAARVNTRKPKKDSAPTESAPAPVPPVVTPARTSALDAMRAAAENAPVAPAVLPIHRAPFVPPVVVKTDEELLEEYAIRLLDQVFSLSPADKEKYRMIIDDVPTPEQQRQLWRARRRAQHS